MGVDVIKRMVKLLEGRSRDIDAEERARIAAGALLVECARSDSTYSDDDRHAVAHALVQLFDLEPEVTDALVAVAEKKSEEVWHDWILTQAVKRGFDVDGRRALIHKLWMITHTDGVLHSREERFVRRIAYELDLSDDDIEASRPEGVPGGGAAV